MVEKLGGLIGQGRQAEIFAWGGDAQVLKLFSTGTPHSYVEDELEVCRAVQRAGLPVPEVRIIVELDGRYGIVFEMISGPSMLRELTSKPWTIFKGAKALAGLHLQMHGTKASGLPSQRDRLTRQITNAQALNDDRRQAILDALGRLPDGDFICHGDFHPDNILISPRGPVILDWPTATSGNPLADVARTSLLLTRGDIPDFIAGRWIINVVRHLFHRSYIQQYLKQTGQTIESIEDWLVPVAAARLDEGIEAEYPMLLRMIDRLLSRKIGP